MTLLEEYYELNENENISGLWRSLQILFYGVIAFFGIWTGYVLATITNIFNHNCYLYGEVQLEIDEFNKSRFQANSEWGSDSECHYCQYTMICSFIFATVWATFFLMCGKGGKALSGLEQPWRIVLPALIFNLIYFVIALISAVKISSGTEVFCTHFESQRDSKDDGYVNSTTRCDGIGSYIDNTLRESNKIVLYLNLVDIIAWINVTGWLVSVLLLSFRIFSVADFELYRVCVHTKETLSQTTSLDQQKSDEVVALVEYVNSDDEQNNTDLDAPSTSSAFLGKQKVRTPPYDPLSESSSVEGDTGYNVPLTSNDRSVPENLKFNDRDTNVPTSVRLRPQKLTNNDKVVKTEVEDPNKNNASGNLRDIEVEVHERNDNQDTKKDGQESYNEELSNIKRESEVSKVVEGSVLPDKAGILQPTVQDSETRGSTRNIDTQTPKLPVLNKKLHED